MSLSQGEFPKKIFFTSLIITLFMKDYKYFFDGNIWAITFYQNLLDNKKISPEKISVKCAMFIAKNLSLGRN